MTSDATTLALLSTLVTKLDSIEAAVKSLKEGLSAIPFLSAGQESLTRLKSSFEAVQFTNRG